MKNAGFVSPSVNNSVRTRSFCALLVVAAALLGSVSANAIDTLPGTPRFDHISRKDGLSNASVSSIVQDRRGFLWFGTQGGLNRYDGLGVQVWEHDPFDGDSLPHNLIQTMYLDPEDDVIWIGTYRGLSRFNIATGAFTNYGHVDGDETSLSDDVVTSVVRGPHGDLWVGTLNGLNRMDTEAGTVTRIADLPHQTVRALHVDDSNRLWVGTYGGLVLLDPIDGSILRTVDVSAGLPAAAVMDIHQIEEHALWLGVWGAGLARYETESGDVQTVPLADRRVYVVNGREDIYAGTWGGGLFRHDPQTGQVERFIHAGEYSLSHNVVYSLMFDDAGVLWIGTNGNGVNRLSARKRNYLRFKSDPEDSDSLSPGKVTAIYRDSHGVLWIGTYTGGLNRYDAVEDKMVHYTHDPRDSHSLSNDIVTSIFEDSRGTLWVTTNRGLNRYDRDHDRFDWMLADPEDPNTIPDDITYCMAEDRDGELWIGTYSAGVSRYDPDTGQFTHYENDSADPSSLSDNLVYTMLVDSRGTLWIGTNNGLNRYHPESDSFVRYLHDENDRSTISSNTVRVLREGPEGRIWIGTVSGGLNVLDPSDETFSHVTKRDGLPDNTVIGILADGLGRLWLATLYGISIVDPDEGVIRNLDEEDGLAGMEFNNGHFRDRDGTLIFGGPHGVSVFSEEVLSENTHAPPVHVLSVEAAGKPVDLRAGLGRVALPYDYASISLEFVALDYEAPSKNTYRHKLLGFDESWIDSGTRNYTTYTNLPPGDYTFVVQGANNDGVWGKIPATLEISVTSPPWLRWWAFLAYGVVLVLVYGIAVRIREGRVLRARVKELTDTRERLQQANERLAALSVEDGLTGVFNRRYLDARIEEEVGRAERSGAPVALLIVDVDRFKAYNDAYGHTAGDECLKMVADTLKGSVNRIADCVARYGGEEFCIVLPQTELDGAKAVAERAMTAIREKAIRHEASDVTDILTVSVGICAWTSTSGRAPKDLLSAADAALYRAKQDGRDRTEVC